MATVSTLSTMVLLTGLPSITSADTVQKVTLQQGVNPQVLQNASVFSNLPGDTPVTVDIVLKMNNKEKLAKYITDTTTPGNKNYRRYLSVQQFRESFGGDSETIKLATAYLRLFGIQSTVYANNLIIAAT